MISIFLLPMSETKVKAAAIPTTAKPAALSHIAWSYQGEKHVTKVHLRRKIGHGLFGKMCSAYPNFLSHPKKADRKKLHFHPSADEKDGWLMFDGSTIAVHNCQTVESAQHCLSKFLELTAEFAGGFGW